MHIDSTFLPLAPGKVLANPQRAKSIPKAFSEWEVRFAPPPEGYIPSSLRFSSSWISMNVFMLNEEVPIVEANQAQLIAMLKAWGFDPVPVPFLRFGTLGGSFHCATLDIRRSGDLQRYF
jgi:glycine amidinotransferase